ncbi:hypothetical protein CJO94_04875 [Ralstonia solanacearum]|nr:hypothetical protein CJO94_04875 [Ralstonia solanacearum]
MLGARWAPPQLRYGGRHGTQPGCGVQQLVDQFGDFAAVVTRMMGELIGARGALVQNNGTCSLSVVGLQVQVVPARCWALGARW